MTRRHQYIEYDRNGTLIYREYYDLVHDPWELSNLFADGIPGNEPNAKLLHARLEALRHCIGDASRVRMADQRAVGFTNDHTYPIGSNPSLA